MILHYPAIDCVNTLKRQVFQETSYGNEKTLLKSRVISMQASPKRSNAHHIIDQFCLLPLLPWFKLQSHRTNI